MKLYVGTYHKYNCGSIYGKWIDLDDYYDVDEFYEACRELHKDEHDPEFMFQDIDYEYGWEKQLYSECGLDNSYWDIKDELSRLKVDENVFSAYCDIQSGTPSSDWVQECEEAYCGKADNDADFCQQIREEFGDTDGLPDWVVVDWDAVARTDMQEFNESNGYYFRAY